MLYAILAATLTASVSADCSRAFLKSATDAYVAAQSSGKTGNFSSFTTPDVVITENNNGTSTNSSILATAIKLDFNRSFHDTVQCATFTELIAASNPHPYVIHTRMTFSNEKATLIESIVTDAGDWLFNATGTLNLVTPEDWSPIPKEKQNTRAVVQSVGDAYFNRFGNASVVVPWGPPCVRVEGGLAAKGNLTGDDCVQAWPSTIKMPYRRYVVDEEYGVVDIFTGFPGLDRTQGEAPMPDSHLFRVENGKIKFLHTASACVVAGCGLNSTFGGGFTRRSLHV